jgi:hypothetical protein
MNSVPYDEWWFWVVFAPILIPIALGAIQVVGAFVVLGRTGFVFLSNFVVVVLLGLLILWGSYSLFGSDLLATIVAWILFAAVTAKWLQHVTGLWDEARGR